MVDLKDFALSMIREAQIDETEGKQQIIRFLEDNNWFGNRPKWQDGKVLLNETQIALYNEPLSKFLKNKDVPKEQLIQDMFERKFPATANKLYQFFRVLDIPEESRFYITDFLLYALKKDIFLMNDGEVKELLEIAYDELIKAHGDILTFFLSWLKNECKTAYFNDYTMEKRITLEKNGQAYDFDEYLELLYYLYNEDYIRGNDMYRKAAASKNYADTWLYLSMYYICSLRVTDLKRIKHPILPNAPEEIIEEISNGTFSDADARQVVFSITWRLCVLPIFPNKTQDKGGVSAVKFIVPESCEVHIGTLFALCEAHHQLAGLSDDEPLIRNIYKYEDITRYMGDEIGELFLEANFHSRSANKSYLQAVYLLTDDIIGIENDGPNVKGYILAALARSHKGSFGEFTSTTAVYLKDAKMSGLTPEFVAMELFERGVLSFVPSMLLKIITDRQYNQLSVQGQTELIKVLNLSPAEIERAVAITDMAKREAVDAVKSICVNRSETDILDALHMIGTGSAFSKQKECLCLMTAFKKVCPYNDKRHCIGCTYEISTKSTVVLLVNEYNRLLTLYENTEDALEKAKHKNIITQVVLPSMDEVLTCIKEQYGQETYEILESLIKENIL